jgi:hypothetical protein
VEETEAQSIKLKAVKRKESIKEEVVEEKIETAEHVPVEMAFPKRERPELEEMPRPTPAPKEEEITPEEEAQVQTKPSRRKSSIFEDAKGVVISKVEVRRHCGCCCME